MNLKTTKQFLAAGALGGVIEGRCCALSSHRGGHLVARRCAPRRSYPARSECLQAFSRGSTKRGVAAVTADPRQGGPCYCDVHPFAQIADASALFTDVAEFTPSKSRINRTGIPMEQAGILPMVALGRRRMLGGETQ